MHWARRFGYLLLLAVMLAFPYGPLFPWSPVHPGYTKVPFQRADILCADGATLDPAYRDIDQDIADAERFHDLKFDRRITVVACRDWNDFHRFVPHVSGTAVGAVTLGTGTVIYVTPKIAEMHFDTGEFLRHELSHAALNQHQNLLNALRLVDQAWFMEGVAVLVGRQRSYISGAELAARAQHEDLWPVFDGSRQRDMRLAYQAWRYFWVWRIAQSGRTPYLRLQEACISDPDGCRNDFQDVYGITLKEAVERYQSDLRSGRFEPRD